MMTILKRSLALILFTLIISCKDDEEAAVNTLQYFEEHLQKDMSHDSLVTLFGKPEKDLGSGIHIYVYGLNDGTEVWVGVTDKVLYANHVDADQSVIKVLI